MESHKEAAALSSASSPPEVNWIAGLLFTLEMYHVLTHIMVLFGLRMLPRKDLVRQRFYFLFDTLTIFSTNFLFLGQLRWLAAVQMTQHFSYIIWWDKADFCKRVISWSSLDWCYTYQHRYDWGLIIGTTFDLVCHLVNAFLLGLFHLPVLHVFVCFVVANLGLGVVVFNPKLAWSTPNVNVPAWVKRRISVLEEDVGIQKIQNARDE